MKSLTNVTLKTKENRKYHNPKTNVLLSRQVLREPAKFSRLRVSLGQGREYDVKNCGDKLALDPVAWWDTFVSEKSHVRYTSLKTTCHFQMLQYNCLNENI